MTNEVCINILGHSVHNLLILTHTDLALLSLSSIQFNTGTLSIYFIQEKKAFKTCRCRGSIKGGGKGPKEVLPNGTGQKGRVVGVDGAPSRCPSIDVTNCATTQ